MHLAVEQNRRRFYKRNFGLMSVYKKQKQTTIVNTKTKHTKLSVITSLINN